MAEISEKRALGGTFANEEILARIRYRFPEDGGATGAQDLFEATTDVIITYFHAVVKRACTSGGSATVKVGITGDDDAFITTTQGAVANLTDEAFIKPSLTEGTPNTVALPLKLSSGDKVLQTIGTAALTDGEIEYVIKYTRA